MEECCLENKLPLIASSLPRFILFILSTVALGKSSEKSKNFLEKTQTKERGNEPALVGLATRRQQVEVSIDGN